MAFSFGASAFGSSSEFGAPSAAAPTAAAFAFGGFGAPTPAAPSSSPFGSSSKASAPAPAPSSAGFIFGAAAPTAFGAPEFGGFSFLSAASPFVSGPDGRSPKPPAHTQQMSSASPPGGAGVSSASSAKVLPASPAPKGSKKAASSASPASAAQRGRAVDRSQPCVVFVVGELNSGKSSFINALAGGFVSNTSQQRETFQPIWYQFSPDGTEETVQSLSTQLQNAHAKNENSRKQLDALTEEQVSTVLMATDDDNELPTRWGLSKFVLIDFPGINDSEDADKKLFFKAIRKRIPQADVILYITDAKNALTRSSEVEQFRQIQELVQAENEQGHFVELAVVVNKFDALEADDLKQIYARAVEKLGNMEVDKKHVSRFSSHKMLIRNVMKHGLELYMPPFIRTEVEAIIKGCNMKLTADARKRIKKTKTLLHSDIVIERDLGDDLLTDDDEEEEASSDDEGQEKETADEEEEEERSIDTGAYEELIDFIQHFQSQLPQRRIDALTAYLKDQWTKAKAAVMDEQEYLNRNPQPELTIVFKLRERFVELDAQEVWDKTLFDIDEWWTLAQKDGVANNPHTWLGQLVRAMLRFTADHPQTLCSGARFRIWSVGFCSCRWDLHAWYCQFAIVQQTYFEQVGMDEHTLKWFIAFASDQCTWDGERTEGYSSGFIGAPKWPLGRGLWTPHGTKTAELPSTYGTHRSWIIHNLLNSPHTPRCLRLLIRCAITPVSHLQAILLAADPVVLAALTWLDAELPLLLSAVLFSSEEFPQTEALEARFFKLRQEPAIMQMLETHTHLLAMAKLPA